MLKTIIKEGRTFYSSVRYSTNGKKTCFFVKIILTLPLAFFIHSALLLINMFRTVKIGLLVAEGRPSRMLPHVESFVRKLNLEGINNPLVIVINPGPDPNEQVTDMYRRVVYLLDEKNPIIRFLFAVTHVFFSSYSRIGVHLMGGLTEKFRDVWQKGVPVLSFTEEEEKEGKIFLERLGIPPGSEYVCIGFKEKSYYDHISKQWQQKGMLLTNRHAEKIVSCFTDSPSLSTYLPAMINCANQGFYVIYMGQFSKLRLPRKLHKNIIDYSPELRTAFRDVYLLAKCKFVIAAGAPGLWWFSTIFNRPVVLTDNYALRIIGLRKGDLCITIKWYSKKKRRFLNFKEVREKGVLYFYLGENSKDGVIPVHNTSKEIDDIIQEMIKRLNRTWKTTKKDRLLQKKFVDLFEPNEIRYTYYGRIGSKFLHNNKLSLLNF